MPPDPAFPERESGGILLAQVTSTVPYDAEAGSLYRSDDGSGAAYFTAFPASYWQRWSVLDRVELRVRATVSSTVRVWRSNAEGAASIVATSTIDAGAEARIELPLTSFVEGGWYWFDLDSGELSNAGWWSPAGFAPARRCRASLGITTLNREQYVLPLLRTIAAAEDVVALLDRVFLVDHGSRPVRNAPGFAAVEASFAGKLTLIEQPNLGGSGGFSRSMLETMDAGSDAVIILDDDVAVDAESLRRLIRFEEFATQPLVVGGHMFDMQHRSRLLALAEGFRLDRFIWQVLGPSRIDLAQNALRTTPALHRRGDAEYTGWWMCLIPTEVLRKTGLSFPFFLKWDDAEFGLRAAEHGVRTVSLPGAAVWHVSWDDKDDTVDWQAYFHARNRLIAALLHSPYRHGRWATWQELAIAIKNVLALEYGAQALRNDGYRAVLSGPDDLHRGLSTGISALRSTLAEYDSGVTLDRSAVPPSSSDGVMIPRPTGLALAIHALGLALRMLRRGGSGGGEPEAELSAERTRWWIQGRYDSVVVAGADPSTVRWLRRDRRIGFELLRDAWTLTRRIRREWPRLRATYRTSAPQLVSTARWRETTSAIVDH